MASVALPESGESRQAEPLPFQRVVLVVVVGAEVAWVVGLGFLLIHVVG